MSDSVIIPVGTTAASEPARQGESPRPAPNVEPAKFKQPDEARNELFYYKFTGSLLFASPEDAAKAGAMLSAHPDSAFCVGKTSPDPVQVRKNRLVIEDHRQCSGEMYLRTERLIWEVAPTARSGSVRCSFSATGESFAALVMTPACVRRQQGVSQKLAERRARGKV